MFKLSEMEEIKSVGGGGLPQYKTQHKIDRKQHSVGLHKGGGGGGGGGGGTVKHKNTKKIVRLSVSGAAARNKLTPCSASKSVSGNAGAFLFA